MNKGNSAPKMVFTREEQEAAQEIVKICQRLYHNGWLAACDGNVSLRLSDGDVLITPSARPKAFISAEEMAKVKLDGTVVFGKPSSETKMHLEIYRNAPKARAVVHSHPPTATAWTIAYPDLSELPCNSCSELILALGSVPFVPYARPGTQAMGDNLRSFLPDRRVLVLRNHGALSWGEDLEEAYFGTERLEHAAKLLSTAKAISPGGSLPELPAAEIAELKKLRSTIGDRIL